MPSRWESSGRPLFVRTVWIKGIRHVVLSKNDPLLQRAVQDIAFLTTPSTPVSATTNTATPSPTSTSSMTSDSSTYSVEVLSESNLNDHLAKLQDEELHRQPDNGADDESRKPGNEQKLYFPRRKSESGTGGRKLFLPIEDSLDPGLRNVRLEQNPLSDRVMKWLDLSGKSLLETTMISERPDLEKHRDGKKSRCKHLKKYMKHRSASLNIINTQYDMTLAADIRIEGNPRHQQLVHFENAHPEKEISTKMNKVYELKRSNSVIPLSVSPHSVECLRPTTTDATPVSTKTKLHIFVPLIRESDSISEDNEECF